MDNERKCRVTEVRKINKKTIYTMEIKSEETMVAH